MARAFAATVAAMGLACAEAPPSFEPADATAPDASTSTPLCQPGDLPRLSAVAPACGGYAGLPDGVTDEPQNVRVHCAQADLTLSLVDDAIVRLRCENGHPGRTPAVIDRAPPGASLRVGNGCGQLFVCSDELALSVELADCRVHAEDRAGAALLDDAGGGYFQTVHPDGSGARGVVRVAADGERFYGLGEKTGPLDKRGPLVQWSDERAVDPLTLDVFPAATPSSFSLYEDDGDSLQHEQGRSSTVTYTLEQTSTGARLSASARTGTWEPPSRTLRVRARRIDHGASGVRLDGAPLLSFASEAALLAAGSGWFYDAEDRSLEILLADRAGFTLELDYDLAVAELRPTVKLPIEVTVPAGTPTTTPIYVSSSANHWTQQPLAWSTTPNVATGFIEAERGAWLFYKYTRGSFATVEKWPHCAEATNRYAFAAAHPVKRDAVYGWADACP